MRRQVMIRQGCVDGFSDADPVITVFRGIPYAKPPVDELRWREPQPAEAWDACSKPVISRDADAAAARLG